MSSPLARGLFHKAIIESGSGSVFPSARPRSSLPRKPASGWRRSSASMARRTWPRRCEPRSGQTHRGGGDRRWSIERISPSTAGRSPRPCMTCSRTGSSTRGSRCPSSGTAADASRRSPGPDERGQGRGAENTRKLWSKFAATGDPSVEGLVTWPAYAGDGGSYLEIAETLQVKERIQQAYVAPPGAAPSAVGSGAGEGAAAPATGNPR
jgi:hypothetical protein